MYYYKCICIINLWLPCSQPVNPVMLHTPGIPLIPRCGLGGPSSEHTMCQLFAVYIVLQKCVYEAAGCNTSACVYMKLLLYLRV